MVGSYFPLNLFYKHYLIAICKLKRANIPLLYIEYLDSIEFFLGLGIVNQKAHGINKAT